MATSVFLALQAAVAALFAGLASGNIQQNRDFSLASDVATQIHVNVGETDALQLHMGLDSPLDFDTEIEVTFLARKSGATEATAVADALFVDAYGLVMADQTIGARVWELQPGAAVYANDEAEVSLARLTWTFRVKHRATSNTISS